MAAFTIARDQAEVCEVIAFRCAGEDADGQTGSVTLQRMTVKATRGKKSISFDYFERDGIMLRLTDLQEASVDWSKLTGINRYHQLYVSVPKEMRGTWIPVRQALLLVEQLKLANDKLWQGGLASLVSSVSPDPLAPVSPAKSVSRTNPE